MTKPHPLSVSVTRVIDAPEETVYDLIADVTAIGRFSPETVSAEWLDGATAAVVGARFKGNNELGKLRWSTKPTVIAADRGRCFAFVVPGRGGPTWTYDLVACEAGTQVTESMHQEKASPLPIRLLQRRAGVTDRAAHLRTAMTTTLDRLAEAAVPAAATGLR